MSWSISVSGKKEQCIEQIKHLPRYDNDVRENIEQKAVAVAVILAELEQSHGDMIDMGTGQSTGNAKLFSITAWGHADAHGYRNVKIEIDYTTT